MSRLIDAFALCEYANNLKDKQVDANDIMRFPRVDAEPVRHGRWRDSRDTGVLFMECSVCKARAKKYAYLGAVGTNGIRFCPYCGAKMDERREDADT